MLSSRRRCSRSQPSTDLQTNKTYRHLCSLELDTRKDNIIKFGECIFLAHMPWLFLCCKCPVYMCMLVVKWLALRYLLSGWPGFDFWPLQNAFVCHFGQKCLLYTWHFLSLHLQMKDCTVRYAPQGGSVNMYLSHCDWVWQHTCEFDWDTVTSDWRQGRGTS